MIETASFAKRLSKTLNQDSEAIRETLRLKCRRSLYFLAKAILGYRDLTPSFHRRLCYEVQSNAHRRKLLEVPRGHLKTTIATRSFPIWRLIQQPDPPVFWGQDERILLVMSGGEVASVQVQAIEGHFQSNQLFRWLFTELIPEDFQKTIWNTMEMRIRDTSTTEPSITVGGVGSKLTGRHFTGIIEDDLVDETICDSELEISRRINWHQYAFPLLEAPGRDWIHTIGNRWAKRDINGWIRENEPDCYLMHAKAINDGRSLWPERFSIEELARIRIKLGPYKFGCQYMNDPKDPEAAAFKSAWLRHYELGKDPVSGAEVAILDSGEFSPLNEMYKYMVVDPAQTPGNRSDRTGIVVTGVDKNGRIFILDAVAVRKDPHEALHDVYAIYNKWRPSQLAIEAVAFSRLLIHSLERMARERSQWLPVIPIKGANTAGAKEARINQVIGETFASGRALIRREMNDFIDEYSWFPDPTTTRDLLDAYALSDQLWIFAGRKRLQSPDEEARMWLQAARAAGMSEVTGA